MVIFKHSSLNTIKQIEIMMLWIPAGSPQGTRYPIDLEDTRTIYYVSVVSDCENKASELIRFALLK